MEVAGAKYIDSSASQVAASSFYSQYKAEQSIYSNGAKGDIKGMQRTKEKLDEESLW
jgi:hypothetical protein